MKKTILSKLLFTIVIGLFAISNTLGQATNNNGTYDATHMVLLGSSYEYNVVLHGSNTYTWEIVEKADPTNVLEVLVDKGTNIQDFIWNTDVTKPWRADGNEVILRVSEYADHGTDDICSSISEITLSYIGTAATIAFDPNTDDFHCSGEDGSLVVKFNGFAPWTVSVKDETTNTMVLDNITLNIGDPGVTDLANGFYTYEITLAKVDYLVSGAADVTHAFTITAFDDKNTSKAAGIDGSISNGNRNVTFYKLPEISTINHN